MNDPIPKAFAAIDLETAYNSACAICEIGLVEFVDGLLTKTRTWRVRPHRPVTESHRRIHGISNADLRSAPTWKDVYPEFLREVQGKHIVSHTHFDRRVLFRSCCASRLPMFSYQSWIDSCAMARRAWPGLAGYSLPSLAKHHNIPYEAHRAVEDARVAGMLVVLAAQSESHTGWARV